MKNQLKRLFFLTVTMAALAALHASAQDHAKIASRIIRPVDDAQRSTIVGTRTPRANPARDQGAVESSLPMQGMSLDFARTPLQEADLQALIAAQQDIHSPLYHQWLSPDQFGLRFGVSDADIATTETWLRSKGFTIESVARGRNHIIFSGTAGQVEEAFQSPIHNFTGRDGKIHIAPANDLTIPEALASSVGFVRNLTSFVPHRHLKRPATPRTNHPSFTNGANTGYLLSPQDLNTMYDVSAAYSAGYTGAGQSIAVVGISYILPSDIATFQKLAGVPTAKPPIYVLVPATGAPARLAGDESESDLDVEYSSTIGKGAQVYFVYDGNSKLSDPFFAIQYAIDEKIAPIITNSYGECELDETKAEIQAFDAILAQGVAQGQTLLSAAGDDGAVDCIEDYPDATINTLALAQSTAVDYPGSSPYFTSMGGTAFSAANYTFPNTTYWNNSTGGVDTVSTVKKYIPEVVWNDDDPNYGTSAGGGGISLYEARPAWQAVGTVIGGTALPTGTLRLVPDISLFASPDDPGMLVCSSDPDALYPGQVGSCTNGFADAVSGDYTIFGGTSFDGPIFSGMLAILNQALNSTGQGNINPTLYSLANTTINPTVYASAFHDITTGTNACNVGVALCGSGPATTNYVAGPGYDEASGIGSIDLMNLITAWPKLAASSLASTTTAVTVASANPAQNTADVFTITVASATTPIPTGTVSVSVDGTVVNALLALTNGAATYSFSSGFLGTHVVTAVYSGDTTHAGSQGVLSISVGTTIPSFTLSVPGQTVTDGNLITATATITPVGGYTGLINFSVTAPGALANACYVLGSATVTGTAPVSATISIYTNINSCPAGATSLAQKKTLAAQNLPPRSPASPWRKAPLPFAAGMLLLVAGFRRSRLLSRSMASLALVVLSIATLASITGCQATPNTTVTSQTAYEPAKAAYTVTLTGSDSQNPTLSASTTFTLTVQ